MRTIKELIGGDRERLPGTIGKTSLFVKEIIERYGQGGNYVFDPASLVYLFPSVPEEQEEEAYQEIKDAFGVDPVRIFVRPKELKFVNAEIDKTLQLAEIYYQYEEENLVYFINASYTEASWSMDVEDQVTNTYYKFFPDRK